MALGSLPGVLAQPRLAERVLILPKHRTCAQPDEQLRLPGCTRWQSSRWPQQLTREEPDAGIAEITARPIRSVTTDLFSAGKIFFVFLQRAKLNCYMYGTWLTTRGARPATARGTCPHPAQAPHLRTTRRAVTAPRLHSLAVQPVATATHSGGARCRDRRNHRVTHPLRHNGPLLSRQVVFLYFCSVRN